MSYVPAKQGSSKDSKRLKRLREKMDMTQRALAKEFYVSPGAIALWENGERPIPGPVLKLIEIFENQIKGK